MSTKATARSSIEQQLRKFLADNFILENQGADIDSEESLTQSGVLDSMGVLELIMYIEEEFGVRIPDEDTLPENLDSISRVVSYVSRRLTDG